MGNTTKKNKASQKNPTKSTTYMTNIDQLKSLIKESSYRNIWLFSYSSRHEQLRLMEPEKMKESDFIIDEITLLMENYNHMVNLSGDSLQSYFIDFCHGLAYAYHKTTPLVDFVDFFLENRYMGFGDIIACLTPEELKVVHRLHELSYEYGFLITELWLQLPDPKEYADLFTRAYPNEADQNFVYPKTFIKKDSFSKGLEALLYPHSAEPKKHWDLVVFLREDQIDQIDQCISSEMKDAWGIEGRQILGDKNNYKIALYIDRKLTIPSTAIFALKLQVDLLKADSRHQAFRDPKNIEGGGKVLKKYEREKLSTALKHLKLTEGLNYKRWPTNTDNIRRAIGLYIWDQFNLINVDGASRKAIINDYINHLKAETPEVLELYFSKFNEPTSPGSTTTLGDSNKHFQTVVREMEADCDLAAHCIKEAEYFIPYDLKGLK